MLVSEQAMRCSVTKLVLLLHISFALGPISANAQALPTKKAAADLLQKAAEAMNLRSAGSPPFHLIAKIDYEIGHKALNGSYELLWVSPDKYRESFKMADFSEIEIALGDKLYILRNTPNMTLPLWSVRKSLISPKNLYAGSEPKVKRVYSAQVGGNDGLCIDYGNDSYERQACLERATNEVVSFHYAAIPPHGPLSITTKELKHLDELELGEFLNLDAKRYPMRIHRQESDEKLEIKIEALTQGTTFPENVFIPPANAIVFDWCSNPVADGKLEIDFRPILEVDPPGAAYAYYVLVGTDGRVRKWAPSRSGGKVVDESMQSRFREAKFPTFSCGNKAIEYETQFNAPIMMRLPHY